MSRMQAGLQLKNAVYSKDLNVRALHQQRWLQFPEEIRNHVKQNVSYTTIQWDRPKIKALDTKPLLLKTETLLVLS